MPHGDALVTALATELGDVVARPGDPAYADALGRIFFPDAARGHPSCVARPRTARDVSTVLRITGRTGGRVTVRGGGLSATCVEDRAVLLDLSAHLTGVDVRDDGRTVVVQGGCRVGAVLAALAPTGRVLPVGIVGHAGFGLATRGGVGYLTRSRGLTLDHLTAVELVTPDGRIHALSSASRGEDADLWWAVRGCAPAFGVVTAATFRTVEQGPMWVERLVFGLDGAEGAAALAAYFAMAPQCSREVTMGAVLGYSDLAPGRPLLLVYTACAEPGAVEAARALDDRVQGATSAPLLHRSELTGRYLAGLPEFALPGADGADPAPISLPEPGDVRGGFYGKSVFTGPTLDLDVAEQLVAALRDAPTPACRIDFQHTGRALGDVPDDATAFHGRSGEWNIPLNAIWDSPDQREAGQDWARRTVRLLDAHTIGVYSVEVRPGFPETPDEIIAAYGSNLPRLRRLQKVVDPAGVLASPLANGA